MGLRCILSALLLSSLPLGAEQVVTLDADQPSTAAAITCKAFQQPDGSDFNWKAISSDEQLKGCLLELAQNLETGDRMAEWFRQQGFDRVLFYPNHLPGGKLVYAEWTPAKQKHPRPYTSFWNGITDRIMPGYQYTCSVEYRDGHPKNTHVGFLYK